MDFTRRGLLATGTAATLGALMPRGAHAAETIKLTMASSHPTTLPWVGVLSNHVVAKSNARLADAGSETQIDWTESYGGALYKFDKTLEAVADGLTDLGWVGTLWEESKMPLQNVTYYTPFVTDNLPLQLSVMNDLHDKIPALNEAWARQKQFFLGASGIETYHLLTKEPFESTAQLDGMKIAAAGSVANLVEGTGAVGVTAGLPDFYNLLNTGVVNGCLISFSGAFPFKLFEPAPYITKVGLGSQMTGGLACNQRVWRRLPEDVQTVLHAMGREYSEMHANMLMGAAAKFEGLMAEAGANITTLAPAERQKWVDALPNVAGDWVEASAGKGLPAGDVLAAYMAAIKAAGETPARDWS